MKQITIFMLFILLPANLLAEAANDSTDYPVIFDRYVAIDSCIIELMDSISMRRYPIYDLTENTIRKYPDEVDYVLHFETYNEK